MLSLSSIIKIYIMFTIVVMIIFFLGFTALDNILNSIWTQELLATQRLFHNIYISVMVISLIAIIFGILVYRFIYSRGLNKYRDLLRRFDTTGTRGIVKPSAIKFPNQDEFGNLGEHFNHFLELLDRYDQLKTILAHLEKEKFQMIAQRLEYPILLIDTDATEPYISYHNDAFRDLFLKKSLFIDIQGKTQIQYYSVENTPIAYFCLKDDTKQLFFSDRQMDKLRNNIILLEKTQYFKDVEFSTLSGDKKYMVGELVFVPFNNNLDKTKHQVMYIFLDVKQLETPVRDASLEYADEIIEME